MASGKISFVMAFLLAWMLSPCLPPVLEAADRVVVIPMETGGAPLQNVVTVAKSRGQFTDPVAAMNSITDASQTNPYLLYIGPGQYTLTTALVMKPFVNVTGSGEQVTWLIGNISSAYRDQRSAIVKGANNAALSNLSVSNTGGANYSFGIFNTGLNLSARLESVSVYARGGSLNAGVVNTDSSSPMITGLNIAVAGTGPIGNFGILNENSSPTILGVNILVWGGSATFGIANTASSVPLIDGSNIYAWDGSTSNVGIVNDNNSNDVKIKRSTISGTTHGLQNIGSIDTRVSQSTLINGATGGGYTCAFVDNNQGKIYNLNCGLIP